MKKIPILSMLAAASTLVAAELKQPVFRMSEPDLLAVVQENGLNDQVTACQELAHKGAESSVPVLAALLTDATPAALFTAARGALQETIRQLKLVNAHILGFVFNGVGEAGSGYYKGYYYKKGYSKYYSGEYYQGYYKIK